MIEEIVSNLYCMKIPLPRSPLKWLNSYVVRGSDRFLIIDTGFNCEECLIAMMTNLKKLGVDLNRTDIFITHLHVDHLGLADMLVKKSSKVYFNEQEAKIINASNEVQKKWWQDILNVYVANGFEAEGARLSLNNHPAHKYSPKRRINFTVVRDGDVIVVGDFHFRCVVTPGHSPGHICLYEANKKILVAGDHILFDITPNIAYWLEMEDALGLYLSNLEKVHELDVKLVLTGHRTLIHDLCRRVGELEEHHRSRLSEVMTALGDGKKNILQIAPLITWDMTAKTWKEFPPAQKWFAFGETLAHVQYLVARGIVRSLSQNGKIKYELT